MAKLHQVGIHRLRPTQITVGMIEVHDKRDKLLSLNKTERQEFLAAHPIPAVWGPDGNLSITDHHHLGRACSEKLIDDPYRSLAGYVRDAGTCATPGASRRRRPRLPNSCGRISSGRASVSGRRDRNSTRVSRPP
jgi:hypothetical protein